MEALLAPTGITVIIILILIVLAILMPVFIYEICNYTRRIKKEIIKLNEGISHLNDRVININKNSTILIELQKGSLISQCSWCKKTFPSSQAKTSQDVILCPDCAHEQTILKGGWILFIVFKTAWKKPGNFHEIHRIFFPMLKI